jgi:subtilisin family serine protease
VQFAAPGADLLAADMRGGLSQVRGTSFAAPIVAGLLSMFRALPGADNESALAQLKEQARDLGKTGRDPIYGFGLVGEQFLHNRKD